MARASKAKADNSGEPSKDAIRWKGELAAASKREKDWRTEAEKIIKRYRGEARQKNRFNVLWSNTQVLRPAIYNSRPNPDVRRRFRDADPVGKAVSEVLERSLSIVIDGDETDASIKNDVLDSLLPGRGVSRVRYVPRITQVIKDQSAVETDDGNTVKGVDTGTEPPPPDEELEGESVCIEHVDWQDYREGYGRVWAEVPWVAFRHKLTRKEALEKFDAAELAGIEFSAQEADHGEDQKLGNDDGYGRKVAEFWEVWDKISGKVFFTQESAKQLIFPKDTPNGEPPFEIDGFFPSPDPLNIMEDTSTRIPVPMFRMYQDEADELDLICLRIDKIVRRLRARGVYDSKLPELADLMSNDDGELTPVQNAQAWSQGGLDKAISWLPIDMLASVLKELYEARTQQKALIDELMGITDIQRGATDPNETLGAQELKQNNSSVRLQNMQREVQRYIKDLLRICTAVMSEKFSPQTFAQMTELNFPTNEQKKALQSQLQQQASMAMMAGQAPPQPGQPPAPPQPPPGPSPEQQAMLKMPSWEDLISVMRSEKRRQYKVDVETDSTIAATLSSDMASLSGVLKAVTEALTEMAPLIQAGALPVDAAKEIVMSIIRRARMGLAVEDAFDKLQAPKPPPDKEAAKAQADMAKSKQEADADIQQTKIKAASDEHMVRIKATADQQTAAIKARLDAWEAQQAQAAQERQNQQEQLMEAQRRHQESQDAMMETKFETMAKIVVAAITAKIDQQTAIAVADRTVESGGEE